MRKRYYSKLKLLLAGTLAIGSQSLVAQKLVFPELAAQERAAGERLSEEAMTEKRVEEELTDAEPAVPGASGPEPGIPLSEPPQDLKDEAGAYELDLVDPFQRGRTAPAVESAEEGLTSTSLGEISEEFRILAIIIPEDGAREPMALIRLQNESTPQVVVKDDLVQIKRRPQERRPPVRMRADSSEESSLEESTLNALESYSFYLHIKEIQPTYIEAYQKKSPNETIILRW